MQDISQQFLSAISLDSLLTKFWKYKFFVNMHPAQAIGFKQMMLDLAIDNKLIGEYEQIQKLFQVQSKREGRYNQIRQEMITMSNKLRADLNQFEAVNNAQQITHSCLKLANLFAEYGVHDEAASYYMKVFRGCPDKIGIKKESYFSSWAKEIFYNGETLNLSLFLTVPLEKGSKPDVNFTIIKDLRCVSLRNKANFEYMLQAKFEFPQLLANTIINVNDLGYLYSILALDYLKREKIREVPFWSSKIEVSFLQHDYHKTLVELQRYYKQAGQFNPIIHLVFANSFPRISERILKEVARAYQMISLKRLEELSSVKERTIRHFFNEKQNDEFLYDSITDSIVYYQKEVPLFSEARTYYQRTKERFEQKCRLLATEEEAEDQFLKRMW